MKAFVVIEVPSEEYLEYLAENGVELEELVTIDIPFIVGVFNKLKLAKEVANEFLEKNEGRYEYLIEQYEVNDVYFKNEEEAQKEISECLEEMVKDGIVDYKIGEDGQFYFEVVEDKEEDNESNRDKKKSK